MTQLDGNGDGDTSLSPFSCLGPDTVLSKRWGVNSASAKNDGQRRFEFILSKEARDHLRIEYFNSLTVFRDSSRGATDQSTQSRGGERRAIAMAPTSSRSKGAGKEEKKGDDASETPAYSQENVQHNMRITYYSRTFLSIVGGIIAGVLGLTAISGFLLYFLIMVLVSGGIAAKTKFDLFSYFDSWQRITIDGIAAGFMSFVLFWTFAYDIVHIF